MSITSGPQDAESQRQRTLLELESESGQILL